MALTPIAVRVGASLAEAAPPDEMDEDFDGAGADVLMIGFSRFGQIASQVLLSGGASVTIIDHSARRVRAVEKFGFRIYFGDGRRKDVLDAAGIGDAKIVAVCTHGRETTDMIVDLIQHEYPHVKLFVRAYDRTHALALRERGVDYEIRETFESGLAFGRETLHELGTPDTDALQIAEEVRLRDEERLRVQASTGALTGGSQMAPEPLGTPSRKFKRLDKRGDDMEETAPATENSTTG